MHFTEPEPCTVNSEWQYNLRYITTATQRGKSVLLALSAVLLPDEMECNS